MRPESRKYLGDMLECAQAIQEFVKGRRAEDLGTDNLLRSAIYWQYAVIGEALSQLTRVDEATAEHISEHRRIIGFRNQIVHGYARIDDEITWGITQTKLPKLIADIERLLRE